MRLFIGGKWLPAGYDVYTSSVDFAAEILRNCKVLHVRLTLDKDDGRYIAGVIAQLVKGGELGSKFSIDFPANLVEYMEVNGVKDLIREVEYFDSCVEFFEDRIVDVQILKSMLRGRSLASIIRKNGVKKAWKIIEEIAEEGHGHVVRRSDGAKTLCGGSPYCEKCLSDSDKLNEFFR